MKSHLIFLFLLISSFYSEAQIQTKIGLGPNFNYPKGSNTLFQNLQSTTTYFVEMGAVQKTKTVNFHLNMQWKQIRYLDPNPNTSGSVFEQFEFRTNHAVLNPSIEFKLIKQLGVSVGGYGSYSFGEMFKINGLWQSPLVGGRLTKEIDYGLSAGAFIYITESVSIGAQYSKGLANVNAVQFLDRNGQLLPNAWLRNAGLQVKLNYYFGDW